MNYKINKSMFLAGSVSLMLSTTSFADTSFWVDDHVIGKSGPHYCDGGPGQHWDYSLHTCVKDSDQPVVKISDLPVEVTPK